MFDIAALERFCKDIGCEYLKNEPMSRHTTFKIGGPAELFALPASADMLVRLLQKCRELGAAVTVVGKGSNLLVSDEGIEGCVICIGQKMAEIRLENDHVVCSAGTSLAELCKFAEEHSLAGLEFAYGIPGSVGGAVYMNAGAYGGEMKDVVAFARHISADGAAGEITAEELDFGYRKSAYTGSDKIIVEAGFRLTKGDRAEIRSRMDELLGRRKDKQPLEYPSAGSVFKRPEGAFAGALIEGCGFKGKGVGGAMVSPKHAGFIVNAGGATCRDVEELVLQIRQKVKAETGYDLECEIKRIGKPRQ
ncbi:MAG: UDP-N-acetylmuramate dehydrogenase [Oscillospiraceae bacterium]|nr:UDP-N-acetylmuramate dehydrogenase [Oscillospiraceae bacterium]